MKKLTILTKENKSNITGGNIYNNYLFERIITRFNGEVEWVTDKDIPILQTTPKLFRPFSYFKIGKKIHTTDYLLCEISELRLVLFLKYISLSKRRPVIFVIVHHLGFLSFPKYSIGRLIYRFAESIMLKSASKVLMFNRFPYDYAIKKMGISADRLKLLEIAIEKKKRPQMTKHEFGNFLYVGTIEQRKGICYLILALKQLKNYNFMMHFVGKFDKESDYFKKINKLIQNSNLRDKVVFHGRVSAEELGDFYAHASAFVLPSLNEGFGLVIAEAMSYGVPVIAFDNTAMPYLIRDGVNGYLIKTKDYGGFAKKMISILEDVKLSETLGKKAIETYESIRDMPALENDINHFVDELNE